MNELTFLLWMSDVIPNVGGITGFAAIISFLAATCTTLGGMFICTDSSREEEIAFWEKLRLRFVHSAKILWTVCFFTTILFSLAPTHTTFLAMAASEAADMAIHTPAGQEVTSEALDALKNWVHDQSQPKKEKSQ